MKQINVLDKVLNRNVGAVQLDNGDVIMCDSGDYVKHDKFIDESKYLVVEEYKEWVDLTDEIIGN